MTCRLQFLSAFLVCVALLVTALYLQHGTGLEPCPLCILQRLALMLIAVIALLGWLYPRGVGRRVYATLATLVAVLGMAVAARHVWLQNLPPDAVPECGPGLRFLLEVFPLQKALALILQGSGECAEVQWRLLGLTLPGWSLVWLVLLALWCGWIAVRRNS